MENSEQVVFHKILVDLFLVLNGRTASPLNEALNPALI